MPVLQDGPALYGRPDIPGFMHDVGSTVFPSPEAGLESKEEVRGVYSQQPTGELLRIYEQQQEELVKLSKELEEFTKKNIELSTSNLQQLQKLHSSNSPVVANIVMQPPRLSQLNLQVRQQSQRMDILPHVEGADMVRGASLGGVPGERDGGENLLDADDSDHVAPQGICTQEDAAAILLQMSHRMVDGP